MSIVLAFISGTLFGVLMTTLVLSRRSATGILRVDHSDPGKSLYRFEIDDLNILDKKTLVVLKIDHNTNLSQK